ncbi:MAG: hypothetical protein FWG32_09690 [Oscillospiraceae bacterium]|nr:hypothetical protein [Oscillospiraceae bacterium]
MIILFFRAAGGGKQNLASPALTLIVIVMCRFGFVKKKRFLSARLAAA